mgnify:CR=1 FL=1
MSKPNLHMLVNDLASLEERELVFVLSKILPHFTPFKDEPQITNSGFYLGTYSESEGAINISIVAYPDTEKYGEEEMGPDWGLCQSWESEIPGVEYVSNLKQCLSPINGKKISLT